MYVYHIMLLLMVSSNLHLFPPRNNIDHATMTRHDCWLQLANDVKTPYVWKKLLS